MAYTDDERVQIAKKEYDNLRVGSPVTINNGKTIGYVSEVIDNKKTGEQSFIITDGNPKTQKPEEVNHVTVLYQGSLGPDKALDSFENAVEFKVDWWDNNKKILGNVAESYKDPTAVLDPTKQMKSSAKTLNNSMDTYANATFDVYGHSQASTNGQYAVSSLDSQDKINRIQSAFFYQGPNAYSMLDTDQRKTAKQLEGRIFNFVDEKDLVPIGYRVLQGQVNPFHVGTMIFVDSKEMDYGAQHMWGGYQFKDGQLQVTKESLQRFQEAKHKYNMQMMSSQLTALDKLEKKLTASGGGLSSGERIYLEDSRALAVVNHASSEFETAMLSVVMLYQKGIQEAEKSWIDTLSDARSIGVDLTENEILSALANGGCTKQSIVNEPVNEYQQKINKAKEMTEQFTHLAQEIRSKITELVQRDQELAQQLKGLMS